MAIMESINLRPMVERITIEDLTIDRRYQRPADTNRVHKMAAEWREELCGALVVNRRRDSGRLVVVDGQHRWLAAREAGVESVACVIYEIPRVEEPRLFVDWQTQRRAVRPIERHIALIEAKDERAMAVNKILAGHGLARFQAINAAYAIYDRDGAAHLDQVLFVTHSAWPGDTTGQSVAILNGVSQFLLAFPNLSTPQVAERFSAETPRRILAKTREVTSALSAVPSGLALAEVLVRLYNKGRGGSNLKSEVLRKTYYGRRAKRMLDARGVALKP